MLKNNKNRFSNTRFRRIENTNDSSESESESDDDKNNSISNSNNSYDDININNSNINSSYNRNEVENKITLNPDEYDSEEEKEYLKTEKLNYEKRQKEKQQQQQQQQQQRYHDECDEYHDSQEQTTLALDNNSIVSNITSNNNSNGLYKKNKNKNKNKDKNSSGHELPSTTTAILPPSHSLNSDDISVNTTAEHILDILSSDDNSTTTTTTTTNNNSNNSSESTGDTTQDSTNDGSNEFSNEIGSEAQNILFIQNELSRPMSFYSLLRRLLILCILYLIPVSITLSISLIVDWNHNCDYPLKQWTIVQIIIQILLTTNFFFLFINLPSVDDGGNPSATLARIQFIFKTLYRIFGCSYIIWFIVGVIWTFKARSADKCTSSSPYLFWTTYSIVIIQIIIGSLAFMFCCCSCIFSLMRLGLNIDPVNEENVSRGATDSMIRKLSIKKYHEGMLEKDDSNCAICISDYNEGDKIRFLPCNHHYHLDCIDRWLIIDKSCPFCKRDIDKDPNAVDDTANKDRTTNNHNNNSSDDHIDNNNGDVDDNGDTDDNQDGIEMTSFNSRTENTDSIDINILERINLV